MDRLTAEQILEVFRLLGLETEQSRAEFTRFAHPPLLEDPQEFIRLDFTSQQPGAVRHAELA